MDNLPCATRFEMENKEPQVEQGYKLGFVSGNDVSVCVVYVCVYMYKIWNKATKWK